MECVDDSSGLRPRSQVWPHCKGKFKLSGRCQIDTAAHPWPYISGERVSSGAHDLGLIAKYDSAY